VSERARLSVPTPRPQDLGNGHGDAARLQDLSPSDPDGERPSGECIDIPFEVVPTVECQLVTESAVQLHDGGEAQILDVAVRRCATDSHAPLA
jgi:hypothetical protein